jgi:hypothetical protein
MIINHESPFFMITGVARSGTTLLSECLDHHPNILCFSDPMNELFKGFFHFAYYKVSGEKKPAGYPIDHFFFSGDSKVSRFIDSTNFKHEIPDYLRSQLLDRISKRGGKFCPALKDTAQNCQANRFDELILEILLILYKHTPVKDCFRIGFKDAWCEQLLLPLSKTFPNMKFINIIRDPRAVICSNFYSKSKYPLFLSVRDWRKSVFYSWKYQFDSLELKSRFLSLKYEELVENPEKILQQATSFLNVAPSQDMISLKFKKPNSSYENAHDTQTISNESKERWKTDLPGNLRAQIEVYCLPEMKKMGYTNQPEQSGSSPAMHVLLGGAISYDQLGEWCRNLVPVKPFYYTVWQFANTVLELCRLWIYKIDSQSSQLVARFFYKPQYYKWLKEL